MNQEWTRERVVIGVIVTLLVGLFGLLGWFFLFEANKGVTTAPTAESQGDDSSRLACEHFRNVAHDAGKKLLTDAELREKLKEVYENASIATADVRRAAEKMLRNVTHPNVPKMEEAIAEMDVACSAAGH